MIKSNILSLNAGSSSIKFSLFTGENLRKKFSGVLENIGNENTELNFKVGDQSPNQKIPLGRKNFDESSEYLVQFLMENLDFGNIRAVGHRIVQGMHYSEPELINPNLLEFLKKLIPFDPDHLPGEIYLIEIIQKKIPSLMQIACFDTAFHSQMPKLAQLISIPRRYFEKGLKRYGFHGISYSYIMDYLLSRIEYKAMHSKIIIAHLGSGASIAGVQNGHCMDTSMSFSPNSGFMMGSRTGDLDPGLFSYLISEEKMSPEEISFMINRQSGLLGISETSSDMRELKKNRYTDSRADEAINLFIYQVKKFIGAMVSVVNGLDILVFTGGIGQNDPECREIILNGLGYLGIELDKEKNIQNELIISSPGSKVSIWVIPTQEEWMMGRIVHQKLEILGL